ncbi:hypothetical protein ACVRZD_00615 [Streptococcus hongkongensis]
MKNKKSGLLIGLLTGTIAAVVSYLTLPQSDKRHLTEAVNDRVKELQANIARIKKLF